MSEYCGYLLSVQIILRDKFRDESVDRLAAFFNYSDSACKFSFQNPVDSRSDLGREFALGSRAVINYPAL